MGLTLEGLHLQQGSFALRSDLTITEGARVAVMGPSGAGKSTLLLAIAGFVVPVAGRILWNDQDITADAPGQRPLTMLFQDQNLFPHLTVAQNIGLGLSPGLRLTAADNARIAAVGVRVGLDGMGALRPRQLSGGQQSRVALARALIRGRPLWLLDEPFAALGPALKAEMLTLVGEIADETGATVLLVSHDPTDALRLCDQTTLVAEGVAMPPVDTKTLLANPPPALAAYLG